MLAFPSREAALSEVLADGSELMLRDSKLVQELVAQDRTLGERIAEWIRKFVQKLHELFGDSSYAEARAILEAGRNAQELWDHALAKAVETHNAIESKNTATEGGEAQYSEREYENQVDAVLTNTHDPNNHVNMGRTPIALTKILGLPKIPMFATANHVYSIAVSEAQAKTDGRYNSKYRYHDLGSAVVKVIPQLLDHPAVIIKSTTDTNDARFVVVTNQSDKNGNPIMIAVQPAGKGNYFNLEVLDNAFLSGYGKNNFQNYLARAKTENRILYAQKNSQQKQNTTGLRLSNNILSADYTNNLAQFRQIVNQKFAGTIFANDSGSTKMQFSDRDVQQIDRDYLDTVERGDMETAQKMVDEAAEKAFPGSKARASDGKLLRLYHGTDAEFNAFDPGAFGEKNGRGEGFGIYLTDDKTLAQHYGDRLIEGYANITRPAYGSRKTITLSEMKRLIRDLCERDARIQMRDEGYSSLNEALKDTWISGYTDTYSGRPMAVVYGEVARQIYNANDSDVDLIYEIMNADGIVNYRSAMAFYKEVLTPSIGVDGLWYAKSDGSNIILAFNSEQIKSAEPVTYDDDGNVIPLSERFNPENEDIRYSVAEEEDEDGGNELPAPAETQDTSSALLAPSTHGEGLGGPSRAPASTVDDEALQKAAAEKKTALAEKSSRETLKRQIANAEQKLKGFDESERILKEMGLWNDAAKQKLERDRANVKQTIEIDKKALEGKRWAEKSTSNSCGSGFVRENWEYLGRVQEKPVNTKKL